MRRMSSGERLLNCSTREFESREMDGSDAAGAKLAAAYGADDATVYQLPSWLSENLCL